MFRVKRKYPYSSSKKGRYLKRRKLAGALFKGLVPRYGGFAPRQFFRGEWKYKDTAFSAAYNTTPYIQLLNGMVMGTTASTRIGMRISITSIEYRIKLFTTAATGIEQNIRGLLVLDRQPNGVAPVAITEILEAANIASPRNLANRKRYKIIKDFFYNMGATSVATGATTSRVVKKYIKFLKPIRTDYNLGNAGSIADISTNALYWINYGDAGPGNTDVGSSAYVRIRFTDN